MSVYALWKRRAVDDPKILAELEAIEGDAAAIEDRFYRELEFGTGGLRGVMGAGTNRMNIYTVAKASQGLSNYLNRHASAPKVAIAYDSRIDSGRFARTAACVLAANGICVYIYPVLMPTPALSFAVRDLHCDAGVVITASHNPAAYNGYKVYGSDGCQITTGAAKAIQREIDQVDPFDDVRQASFEEKLSAGEIRYIGEETVRRYMAAIAGTSVLPEGAAKDVSIVYTPLNGTGISCVPRCLKEQGFTNITLVEEQKEPDGSFPTCPYPNPEIREALEAGLNWAQKTGSDLLLATDPDCDRVAAAVRTKAGYTLIDGNQMGVLLFDFVCRMRKQQGTMPDAPVAVKTIVTAPMAARVAEYYGVELIDVLTGFKYIGEQIGLLEEKGEESRYIFGFEESCGYLGGVYVRDKDAVSASLLICEMAAYYRALGLSLADVLEQLYAQFGVYESRQITYTYEGADGSRKMRAIMDALRTKPLCSLAGAEITRRIDYRQDGTGLPRADVLRFLMDNGCEAVVRPSGTEPKIKVYLTAAAQTHEACAQMAQRLEDDFTAWVKA